MTSGVFTARQRSIGGRPVSRPYGAAGASQTPVDAADGKVFERGHAGLRVHKLATVALDVSDVD